LSASVIGGGGPASRVLRRSDYNFVTTAAGDSGRSLSRATVAVRWMAAVTCA
jgi:hypothetical protein